MATASAEQAARPRVRLRLAPRLFVALGLLLALLALVLAVYVVPRTSAAFTRHGEDLLAEGIASMRRLTTDQTSSSSKVLVDLIRHTAKSRQRALRDLPIESFGGDIAAIRSAVEAEDEQRSAQQQSNVQVLAHEMQRRADAHIDRFLADLGARQHERTAAFADGLRTTHLTLVTLALVTLLLVLGLGLHLSVIRPTLRLRRATQRVAAGDLQALLPPASGDELGDLSRDFAVMVDQLRDARAAQQRLALGLEQEVRKKTEHLEQTLADLRSSHEQLAQAERLAALGTLAGGIAHEFRNVIGGIRGCAAELLADETAPEPRETLSVIMRAADRASGIVQQLLRFARHSVEQPSEVDPTAVVEDALRLCEPAARRQDVRVERHLQPGLRVHGDSDGLHQVLVNLLTNALQAMPDGGTLRVEVAAARDQVELTVADTGPGIAAADLPHVFEPFFTTRDREPAQERRGTGLGLSVSYGIVMAHGGRITADSTPGAGATFTVVLPRTGAAPAG